MNFFKLGLTLWAFSIATITICRGETQDKKTSIKPLAVGDKVPDVLITNVLNYTSRSFKFSDFKGKLVILDFWDQHCVPCIAAMPHMQQLQKEFKNRIQIILVTKNSRDQFDKIYSKSPLIQKINLPSVIADTVLSNLFYYRTVPTHVWIDENGIVKYKTDGYNTNSNTISAYLNGKSISIKQKNENPDFDINEPLWLEGGGRQAKNMYSYSYFMRRIEDYGSNLLKIKMDSSNNKMTIKAINQPILKLYKIAYGENYDQQSVFFSNNRVITNIENSDELYPPKDANKYDKWLDENVYSYELTMPFSDKKKLFQKMRNDLQNFFHISGEIKLTRVKVLMLVRSSSEDKMRSKGGNSYFRCLNRECTATEIRNYPINQLIDRLNYQNVDNPWPIVDNTKLNGNIDMNINCKLSDISSLKMELLKHGLDLVEGEAELDMLILTKE